MDSKKIERIFYLTVGLSLFIALMAILYTTGVKSLWILLFCVVCAPFSLFGSYLWRKAAIGKRVGDFTKKIKTKEEEMRD